MIAQRTLKKIVHTTGVGLHTGQKVNLTLRPAAPDTGIVFRRIDLDIPIDLPARADAVRDTRLSSCLIVGDVRVSTVEHFMAALAGLGIDNCVIDIDAAEVPIMDGSAAPFVFLIQSAGIEAQAVPKKYLRMIETVEVVQGDKRAALSPHDGFTMDFTIDFEHPTLSEADCRVNVDFGETSFAEGVARARTFCFTKDVEAMHKAGLALGGNLGNAIVLDEFRVLNAEGLRFSDELVKHKLLDALGDLYLLGHPVIGAYTAMKSGHALNNALCRAVLAQPQAWALVNYAEASAHLPRAYQRIADQIPATTGA
jgi:UDP-3-O-[3-hydroxymyristoyl] N-acetylglucosamine deacetylase